MLRGSLYAVAAVAFAVLAVVLPDRLFPPDDNYRVVSVLGEAFRGWVLGTFRAGMGLFSGLALVAGLASLEGAGARRPAALLLSSLFGLLVVGVSGFAFRGPTHFPARGSLEARDRWGGWKLGRPYRAAVDWAAAAPAVREACGTALRFGPARDARNAVSVGGEAWDAAFTLEIAGEKGSGRLGLTLRLPLAPRDARPVVAAATLETGGRVVPLDSSGSPARR